MTRADAQRILAAWRPGTYGPPDAPTRAALDFAAHDPELATWLEEHSRFQTAAHAALESIPVPPGLADRILAARNIARPEFTPPIPRREGRAFALAVAAGLVVLGLAAALWPRPAQPAEFATFRSRAVRGVQREYRMDVVTPDLAVIRDFLASRQAPSDFVLPPKLAAEPTVGGGLISWQGSHASMICLGGGARGMLYLFVLPAERAGIGAPVAPEPLRVGKLPTVAWSADGKTYLLAADHLSLEQLRAYL